MTDFLEIAAVMQSLDLVIAPDTALAHLAGALGVASLAGAFVCAGLAMAAASERTARGIRRCDCFARNDGVIGTRSSTTMAEELPALDRSADSIARRSFSRLRLGVSDRGSRDPRRSSAWRGGAA